MRTHRLKSNGVNKADASVYGYNVGNQRTAYTNVAGGYVHYTYDAIGQLTVDWGQNIRFALLNRNQSGAAREATRCDNQLMPSD